MIAANIEELTLAAREVRLLTLQMTRDGQSSHVGSNFSIVELLTVLYQRILSVNPQDAEWSERDRFILSKGHACAAYYAVLAKQGFFPLEWLTTFYQNGSRLAGHVTHSGIPGVEISTGSLGHGLSVGAGMALAAKRDRKRWRVFCLLSDGECDEGSTWEPILFAPQHKLDNLVAIVDYNKIQSLGSVQEVMNLEPFADKWRAFGWAVREINGHDLSEIEQTLCQVPFKEGMPSCIIAHTVKGKGVSFMEDSLLWHYRTPQGVEYDNAWKELQGEI